MKNAKEKNYISEIAKDLNISVSTVYNVIKNTAPVSEKIRQQVADYVAENGIDLSSFTKTTGQNLKIIAAIPSLPTVFWDQAMQGINDALKNYDMSGIDFRFIRFSRLRDEEETLRMLDIIGKMSPDACIVVPCLSDKVKEKLASMTGNIITAIIDEPVNGSGAFISATGNYEKDGIKAAEIIHDFPLSEKKTLLIDTKVFTHERRDAFMSLCNSFDDTEIVGSIIIEDYTKDLASKLSRNIVALKKDFNCIYIPSGIVGPVCLAIQKLGLSDSVYVVGHDPSPAVKNYFTNGLKGAVIRQDIYVQANVAAKAIMDKLLLGEKKYPDVYETGYSSEIYL